MRKSSELRFDQPSVTQKLFGALESGPATAANNEGRVVDVRTSEAKVLAATLPVRSRQPRLKTAIVRRDDAARRALSLDEDSQAKIFSD